MCTDLKNVPRLISKANGDATQHLQYLPFGEDLVRSLSGAEGHEQNTASYHSPYTFSGKERDVETSLSYFGARYYEAGLSVWLSVDPMSDKYPSLSAYNYCALNPVMLVDPDGREIEITGQDGTTKTCYSPNMSSEGLDEFTAEIVNLYNEAYNGSETAKGMIDELVGSSHTYSVQEGSESQYTPNTGTVTENGKKSIVDLGGGTISINRNGEGVPVEKSKGNINYSKIEKSKLFTLIHETAHASDHQAGKLDLTNTNVFKGEKVNELQAVHTENLVRGQLGAPLRTHYGREGNAGTGFRVLANKSGQIISNFHYQQNKQIVPYR